MKCPGLHCPGCGDGGSIPVAAGLLIAAEVILRAIWWIIGVTAASAALSLAAVVLLSRATARREAAFAMQLAARHEREALTATVTQQVTRGTAAPAIENHYHVHLDSAGREAARIIRQAIPGTAGDASTREE